jgi:hypothetical protein
VDKNPLASTSGLTTAQQLPVREPEPPPEPPYITGGPPFPPFPTDKDKHGTSILDYFAAHIISGLAARSDMPIDELKADGAKHAYWIAAMMVQLRNDLPIEPTPAPPEDLPEEPFAITTIVIPPHD